MQGIYGDNKESDLVRQRPLVDSPRIKVIGVHTRALIHRNRYGEPPDCV